MAPHAAEGAEKAGAEVRLRRVARPATTAEHEATDAQAAHAEAAPQTPAAEPDDIVWADAVLFGSPTRYGNIAGQLKTFIDCLGPQWARACSPTRSTPGSPPARRCTAARSRRCSRRTTRSTTSAGSSWLRTTPTPRSSSTATPTAPRTSPARTPWSRYPTPTSPPCTTPPPAS
ncbi:flavodoxin family protein [Actinokineospora pegani]|uniref:flavodoxin family protein n=1 Tax=Actinokineospora pegani TaxID=2654637 RepID=UPI001F2E0F0A|nr:NAD(P)H-dependent oxidoreductase [Actinokineospora pegani]